MHEDSPAEAYASAMINQKPAFLVAFKELHRLKVCTRCCLRFAGVRSTEYAQPAPSTEQLRKALEAFPPQELTREGVSKTQPPQLPEASASLGQCANLEGGTLDSATHRPITSSASEVAGASDAEIARNSASADNTEGQSGSADNPASLGLAAVSLEALSASQSSQAAELQERPCPVCLGVLQSLDGTSFPLSEGKGAKLPETDGCGAPCQVLPQGSMPAVAAHIRSLGYHFSSFSLELRVPASAQLRQLALWYHLKNLPSTANLYQGLTFRDDAVDLKETLRLGLIAKPLASLLEKSHLQATGDLKVTLSYIHPASADESDHLYGRAQKLSRNRKRQRTGPPLGRPVSIGRYASEDIASRASKQSIEEFSQHNPVPPVEPGQPIHLLVSCRRTPQYIAGHYRKLKRDISQTPWTIDGAKKGRTSVEEEIEKLVLPLLRCDGAKFITAGREDMDVRMLGRGRPFVLEIANQRAAMPSAEQFACIEEQLRESESGVEACRLQAVGKEKLQLIKEGERDKQKRYEALCELPCAVTDDTVQKINSCKDLMLKQTTPIRVAHRRAMLVRERFVYEMSCTPVANEPNQLLLRLRTQAGTYIKEFVHGDDGRTEPHLASFLGIAEPAKILSLDVLEVLLDFF